MLEVTAGGVRFGEEGHALHPYSTVQYCMCVCGGGML